MNRRKAGFPVDKRLAEFDYHYQTTITKRQVSQLLDFRFIDARANQVFIDPLSPPTLHDRQATV